MAIGTFRDLDVWKKAMDFVTLIYRLTRQLPKDEMFGLTSQLRRAAVSVPSNMAEGYGRRSTKDYVRFLQMAVASLFEIQTQLEISLNLQYVADTDYSDAYDRSREIEAMLTSMIGKLKRRST